MRLGPATVLGMKRFPSIIKHVSRRTLSTFWPEPIPHLIVADLSCGAQRTHVQDVARHLQNFGILKISLSFDDDSSRYLHQLILNLHKFYKHGLPITHSASQGWFWDIRPRESQFQSQDCQARSETMEAFPWHSDCSYEASPPRFVALQVIQPDRCGGGVLSALSIDKILRRLPQSAITTLYKPLYRITVPPEFAKSESQRDIIGSLLGTDKHSGAQIMRYRDDIITPLNDEATRACEELKKSVQGPAIQKDVLHLPAEYLTRGSILLMDNGRWLHSRTNVKDPNRHLRRLRWDAKPFGTEGSDIRIKS